MNSIIIAAAGQDVDPMAVLIPPLGEVIISAIVLALILFVVAKYALPKYFQVTDERAQRIAEGLEMSQRAEADSQRAQEEAAAVVAQAQRQAGDIRDQAHTDAKAIVAQSRTDAKGEADRIITAANRQIEAERQAAQISLRSEVGLLASELADKIVGEHLRDEELSARVIDRFLDDLETHSTTAVKGE